MQPVFYWLFADTLLHEFLKGFHLGAEDFSSWQADLKVSCSEFQLCLRFICERVGTPLHLKVACLFLWRIS